MSNWTYNNKRYKSESVDWDELYKKPCPMRLITLEDGLSFSDRGFPVVYHKRWNKCFELQSFRIAGNTNQLSAWIIDIYDSHKCCVTRANELELVKIDE